MSKRKGLSFEEKRTRMLEIFHDSTDFFQLKELEKSAPKQKGIVSQSVKEVVDSLVSDNLVQMDKIGTSNYYWSFPSTALLNTQRKQADVEAETEATRAKLAELEQSIEAGQAGREPCEERTALETELQQAETKLAEMRSELKQYADNDPATLDAKKKCADIAISAANRWTDNIFALQRYCADNFNMDADTFNAQFGVPPELDSLSA